MRWWVRALAVLTTVAMFSVGCSSDGEDLLERAGDATTTTAAQATTSAAPATTAAATTAATGTTVVDRQVDAAAWTLLVYVMGDNDLEPFALTDLLEMTSVGSTDQVNIVALVDRHPAYATDPVGGVADFEDARLFFVAPDELVPGDPLGELNMGSPDVLAQFIQTGVESFPAEHYAVVLWNHGAGWPGMGPDETDGVDILDLAEIDAGFTAGLDAVGLDTVDIVGFDACLMASYEVATTMADHGDFMLASEELEPGHGWNYEAIRQVAESPQSTPRELGLAIIDGFAAQAQELGTAQDITLSMLDLNMMGQVEAALGDLAAPLMAEPALAAPLLAQAQTAALKFGANPDPSLDTYHVDLGNVAAALGSADPTLVDPARVLQDALSTMVVERTNGPATSTATGLSIYFPPFEENFSQGYLFLEDIPVWPDLLTSYYTAGSQIPETEQASFVNTDAQAEYFFDVDGLNIFGTFDLAAQNNLVQAELFYGILDEGDGSIIFIGEEPGEVATDGSGLVGKIYDLTVLTISDGVDTDFAYLDLEIDQDNELLLIDVPLLYVPPEEFETDDPAHDVVLSLITDFDGNVLSEVYYEIGDDGTFGELNADPAGLIFPVVLNQYPDGSSEWLTLSEVGLFADLPSLQYNLEPLEPGLGLYAELVIYDYGGNTDSVAMFDTIPA